MTGHRRRVAPVVVVFLCLCGGVFVGGAAADGGSAASEPTAERTLNTTTPDPGETVRVTATVTRNSSGPVDYLDEFDPAFAEEASLVSLTVDGDPASESLLAEFDDTFILSVEGAPAGTVTITYDVTVPASATQSERYDFDGLAQTGEDDDDQTAVGGESTLVVGGDPPTFELSLSPVPASVTVGETLAVEASVTNVGDVAGTQAVGFAVNGTGQETTTTALAPGETRSVTFEYTVTETDLPAISLTLSSANGTATGTVRVTAPALFAVSSRSVPAGVTVGAQLSGTATVTNLGGETSTQSVTVTVDGEQVTDTLLTLSPDENGSVGFEYAVEEMDGPNLTVTVSSANETVTESVLVTGRALFDVSLSSVPASATAGETLAVEAAVTNVGGETGTQTVALAVDGDDQEQTAVTLDPGESESVEFEYTVADGDGSELSVTVSSANETVTGAVTVVEPASFAVTFGSVPESVTVGEALTVPVVVTNAGGVSGTRTVTVTVDGDPVGATELSLAPGANETVSFEYTVAETDGPILDLAVTSGDDRTTATAAVVSPPQFEVDSPSVSTPATVGDPTVVIVTVTNTGGVTATQSVTLAVDGTTRAGRAVELAGGASETVTFEYTPTEPGNRVLTVASNDSTATATVTVRPSPAFETSLVSIDDTVAAGETVTGVYSVENTGTVGATRTVLLRVAGDPVANRTLTLDGGEQKTVTFNHTPVVDSPTTVEFSVGTATVTVSVTGDGNRTDDGGETDGGNGTGGDNRTATDNSNQTDTGDGMKRNSSDDATGPGFDFVTGLFCLFVACVVVRRQSQYR